MDRRSFGSVELEGPPGARRVIVSACDPTGAILWRHELGEQNLRFPPPAN